MLLTIGLSSFILPLSLLVDPNLSVLKVCGLGTLPSALSSLLLGNLVLILSHCLISCPIWSPLRSLLKNGTNYISVETLAWFTTILAPISHQSRARETSIPRTGWNPFAWTDSMEGEGEDSMAGWGRRQYSLLPYIYHKTSQVQSYSLYPWWCRWSYYGLWWYWTLFCYILL